LVFGKRQGKSNMRDMSTRWRVLILLVLVLAPTIGVVDASNTVSSSTSVPITISKSATTTTRDSDVLKIIEREVWDETSKSWKVLRDEERWSNEQNQACRSPNEAQPPGNWDFDGDWKIVVHESDAMGWEYSFQYLGSPTRKRVWLRSLKAKPLPVVYSSSKRTRGLISRALADMRDGYNFKGLSCRVYKSLLSLESFGVGVSLPLSTNFNFFDRNPSLPSVSTTFGFYFPWTVSAALSASVHVEWVRWFLKNVLFFIPRLLLLLFYRFALPTLWAVATAALLPLGIRLPRIPEAPVMEISKPRYNSDISERLGCSLSYRWSKEYGFEWRFNYWHSFLPTFALIRKLLGTERSAGWFDKHFASMGLSTSCPQPTPPHYSCAACLGFSGLYLKNPTNTRTSFQSSIIDADESETKKSVSNALKESTVTSSHNSDFRAPAQHDRQHHEKEQLPTKPKSAILVAGGMTVPKR
jgi:hypothetical protein